jgi:hypothetical protein
VPDHVADTLDGARHDWLSPSAMRWTPPDGHVLVQSRHVDVAADSGHLICSTPLDRPAPRPNPLDPEVVARLGEGVNGAMATVLRHWQEIMREATQGFNLLHSALRDVGALPDIPPEDPRERALWHVRNRHTGPDSTPVGQQRRPRRHR